MNLEHLSDPKQIDELGTKLSKQGDHIGALECFQRSSLIRSLRSKRGYKNEDIPVAATILKTANKTEPSVSGSHTEPCLHVILLPPHKHALRKLAEKYLSLNPRLNGDSELYSELFFTVHKIANLPKIKIISDPAMHAINLIEDLLKKGTFSPPADYSPAL